MTTTPMAEKPLNMDRRHSQRRRFNAKIEIEWGAAVLAGTVRDIGPRGMFIELMPPLWMGATFVARLGVEPVLSLNCTVRRVEPGMGMGVTVAPLDDSGKAQFEALLAALPLT
jgi:PilZ domain